MAFRFYNLRQHFLTNAIVANELDGIFTNLVSGQLDTANRQLIQLEKAN
jgi:hypothetical protein